MRKIFWFIVIVLAVTFSGFFGFGMNLPKTHAFTVQAVYEASHERVWKAITDYETLPTWSPNIERTKRQHDLEGQPLWRLHAKYGRYMDLHIINEDPELLHVAEIIDGNYPFKGLWRFRLVKGQDDKVMVELTEEGIIESPFWRVVMRNIIGQETSARTFLRELGTYVEKPLSKEVVDTDTPSKEDADGEDKDEKSVADEKAKTEESATQ